MKLFKRINSLDSLEEFASTSGLLPFFPSQIRGISIAEKCAPGKLFGGNFDEGCWEWKGPVIRKKTSIYGKFFKRKAGFVSPELICDFINYRRAKYPVKPGSADEMILEIIRENDSLTSTELKKFIFGKEETTLWKEMLEDGFLPKKVAGKNKMLSYKQNRPKSKSLEGPLQRLQMGGWLLISDFEYKKTRNGERYGWGVARYSTPESFIGDIIDLETHKSPEESLDKIVNVMRKKHPLVLKRSWQQLLS